MSDQYCASCRGITALTGNPYSPVRWCQCPGPRTFRDAEIARLSKLVQSAYVEAWVEGTNDFDDAYKHWLKSDAKKELERQ